MKKVIVIGAGFSGLAAASSLAKEGYDVTVIEKNETPGGRARMFKHDGFTFDMGPTWYWMPDIFEDYFEKFGQKPSDFYKIHRLDPSYRVYFGIDDFIDVPGNVEELYQLFEKMEPGGEKKLKKFLREAKYKYEQGVGEYVWKPGSSIFEYLDLKVIKSVFRIKMLTSISKEIRSLFKNPRLVQLLEFPVLFLGAKPQNTPALYSLMNYADLVLGTWYPEGGMFEVVDAMMNVCKNEGVKFIFNEEVSSFRVIDKAISEVVCGDNSFKSDVVVASADYHHIEQNVLEEKYRLYNAAYWKKRTMAPTALLFYLGLDKKVDSILHHNLFFDEDFDQHANEIYENPQWPRKPLFYITAPSITDQTAAPEGKENMIILVPLAPDLEDTEELREKYYHIIFDRLEKMAGEELRSHVIYKRSYCINDFKSDYNAFRGNAYGLANTLRQTAILKPKMKNKKLKNLYFTGQLTVPGPGVPPSLISGQLVASEIVKEHKN